MKINEEYIDNEIISLRRYFHRNPELSGEETKTAGKVAEILESLDIEVRSGIGGKGVLGVLHGKNPGKTAAVRADMDALPLTENNTVDYASQVPGVMHACGHDSHTAALLGAAMRLGAVRDNFDGCVKFIFQPSEEKPPGGARFMIEEGVLENPPVDIILGMHNSTDTPAGDIIVLDGPVMAASDYFEVKIRGQGGHGAMPERTSDTVLIASHFVVTLQNVINRKFPQGDRPVVSIGRIEGGTAHNIIPKEVFLSGTVRHFNSDSDVMAGEIEEVLKSLVKIFGGNFEFEYFPSYPMTYNDPAVSELVRKTASEVQGVAEVGNTLPRAYASEDFGYFSREKPSCYFIFGGRNEKKGMVHPPHTAEFDLDDGFLPVVSRVITDSVLNFLKGE